MNQGKEAAIVENFSTEPTQKQQKEAWLRPELQEADYNITLFGGQSPTDNAGFGSQ